MSLLAVQELRKSFGARLLFQVEKLQLECGRSYLVTGSNGVGKTTLLRILAGLEEAEAAQFHFEGRPISMSELGKLAPEIIYMHQHPYLFQSSVAANIAYGLQAAGLSKVEIARRVEAEMHWAGLQDIARVPPARLSGGEKQRVALARARVLNPRLLLLDEPTANLDTAARHQVMELITGIGNSNNCVMVATHDRELIAQVWSEKFVLENLELRRLPG